ncbi:MAG: Wzz/FepE/Etk N-terminal domain-containing protein [Peptoniphilaceae bacterium]|nr:Wzz/FepE/Etk N-terminal domain-containing protein [Peptoniphilaceae bacterium]MDD7383645.1 Wzz/FepE/Etk N-terminal domain-containing protein [Peptoniphilaceae bacterium]MDY3737816.1 Wzz/FepE/Etk N-terminal domain-containing protein [Peptoniphilaceae bacterium]
MEKLTVDEIIHSIKRNIKLIILFILIFTFSGFVVSKLLSKQYYKAQTNILLTSQTGEISYNYMMLNEKLIPAYEEMLNSLDFYKKIKSDYDFDLKVESIKSSVEVKTSQESNTIKIFYSDINKTRALDILKAITEEFRKKINKKSLNYIEEPSVKKISSISAKKTIFYFGFFSTIISIFLAIFKDIIDNTIKSKEYIEENDIKILGEIDENKEENLEQYKKVVAKVLSKNKKVIGITAPENSKHLGIISYKIAKEISEYKKTLFLDLNLHARNLLKLEDMNDDIEDFFLNDDFKIHNENNFYTVGSGYSYSNTENITEICLKEKINKLREDFDLIIISEADFKFADTLFLSEFEDSKIIVVNEERSTKKDFRALINDLKEIKIDILGVVYNK